MQNHSLKTMHFKRSSKINHEGYSCYDIDNKSYQGFQDTVMTISAQKDMDLEYDNYHRKHDHHDDMKQMVRSYTPNY